ncbi:MAG: DNA-directed RNA polymerase subunit alpha [Spirochaetota bacterium]|nr:DNA-directed RNA polymerase subunit alpha [Spirochaetota bacterium]
MAHKNLLKGFKRPSRIIFEHEELESNYGKFIAEPFEKGYGLTIGNSIRRVLLSSIEGAAISAIKIEGVPHEFYAIDGVYEDVTRIILNLKQLRLKYHGEIPKVLHVIKEGPSTLVGADFDVDSEIEVMNKDIVIATLNESGKIDIEVQVENGRGYVPAELSKGSSDVIGVIPIDTIFTPIKRVNIRVEDTRVGQRTDYDKLILEIWTDGSISPDDALSQAAKIIKDHMTIFINFEEEIEEDGEVVEEDYERMKGLLLKPVEELGISVRAFNMMNSLDIIVLEQLVRKTEEELRKSKYFSDNTLKEVKEKLEILHLSLGLKE